jgi:hypothetical protein
MPQTKHKSRKQSPTQRVVAKQAKNKNATPGSGAMPLANTRTSISVAELPRTHRATASRERMVGHPNFALNFYTQKQ